MLDYIDTVKQVHALTNRLKNVTAAIDATRTVQRALMTSMLKGAHNKYI